LPVNGSIQINLRNLFVGPKTGRPYYYHDGMSLYRGYFVVGLVDPLGYGNGDHLLHGETSVDKDGASASGSVVHVDESGQGSAGGGEVGVDVVSGSASAGKDGVKIGATAVDVDAEGHLGSEDNNVGAGASAKLATAEATAALEDNSVKIGVNYAFAEVEGKLFITVFGWKWGVAGRARCGGAAKLKLGALVGVDIGPLGGDIITPWAE
jgi:hypothetical protein